MKLREAAALVEARCPAEGDIDISRVTEDSRNAGPGALFVAICGGQNDGHDFAESVRESGVAAIAGERGDITSLAGMPYLCVNHARRALGVLAHELAGRPSDAMTVIGVTGTNGKTSTAFLIQHMLRSAGSSAANFGTLGYFVGDQSLDASHTTPFGEELVGLFAKARDACATHVVMEVSSHALEQERIAGIAFNVAVITNVTQDHLDYHLTMDAYVTAKMKLFSRLGGDNAFGVVNLDDPYADTFRSALTARCVTYGPGGDYRAENVSIASDGSRFTLITPAGTARVRSALAGRHNVANVLAASAVAGGLGLGFDQIVAGIEGFTSVPGRFERVEAGQDFSVVVDYAHTDDGLRNVLATARELGPVRLIVVFGCGGDRDRGKRPKMGAVAAELGDYVIITSDNPRSEDPSQIVSEIETGVRGKQVSGTHHEVILDRERAIRRAIGMASTGDLVMIAGKGHEGYQILGANRIHFDDREVARAALESRRQS